MHSPIRKAKSMSDIPGFWTEGPHEALSVEQHWKAFVASLGGIVLSDQLSEPRIFENADFAFFAESVVAELKEVETEFSDSPAFARGFRDLAGKLQAKRPDWKAKLEPSGLELEDWFRADFVRIFRPALGRILKKANRQLRETKAHFGINSNTGILLLVNDGFRSISPMLIRAQVAELLEHSYSSVDCFIYLTVNRYVEVQGSIEPKLLWVPAYSDRVSDDLVTFVNSLGSRWFDYLEAQLGPFTSRRVGLDLAPELHGSRYVVLPGEVGG